MPSTEHFVCTFDLEPWWTIVPPVVSRDVWDHLPDRSEGPLWEFLEMCESTGSRATVFVVGEYARRFPARIRQIAALGHEIGCHSLYHDDLATQPLGQIREETGTAKDVLEQAIGIAVQTFRAPSFSVPEQGLRDFFEILQDLGFTIDSSLSSAARVYGSASRLGLVGRVFSLRELTGTNMVEVGIPGVPILGREWTIFGGGYLRVTPTSLALRALRRSPYQVLYLHPHDLDPQCPRVPGTNLGQHLRRRLCLGALSDRVRTLLLERPGITCAMAAERLLSRHP